MVGENDWGNDGGADAAPLDEHDWWEATNRASTAAAAEAFHEAPAELGREVLPAASRHLRPSGGVKGGAIKGCAVKGGGLKAALVENSAVKAVLGSHGALAAVGGVVAVAALVIVAVVAFAGNSSPDDSALRTDSFGNGDKSRSVDGGGDKTSDSTSPSSTGATTTAPASTTTTLPASATSTKTPGSGGPVVVDPPADPPVTVPPTAPPVTRPPATTTPTPPAGPTITSFTGRSATTAACTRTQRLSVTFTWSSQRGESATLTDGETSASVPTNSKHTTCSPAGRVWTLTVVGARGTTPAVATRTVPAVAVS